jgi:hypothetical protein
MNQFRPEAILEVLDHDRVECGVIGGYAATLYGASRPTLDIDVTPERSHANLTRLVAVLEDLDARIRVAGIPEGLPFSTDAEALATMAMLNLITRHGELDISMMPGGTGGYEDLIRNAAPQQIGDIQAKVASLADVIRSKEAASRPKDFEALPELHRLQHQQAEQRLHLSIASKTPTHEPQADTPTS